MRLRTANNRVSHAVKKSAWLYRQSRTKRQRKKEDQRWTKYWEQYRKPGVVYHSCALHPCYVTKLDIEDNSIFGKSLLDGSEGHNCSLTSCGVYMMKEEEVQRYKEAWDRDGERGILAVYYGSEKAADEFIKNWR